MRQQPGLSARAASGETAASGQAGPSTPPVRLDRIDRKIIVELQRDAAVSLSQLADRVGLSQTPCWKRVQKLEQAGVITRRVALVDPQKAGVGLTAFVAVAASDHSPAWREAFAQAVEGMAEVTEVWRMAGESDYLLKVVARDMAAFDAFYRRLTATMELKSVISQFAMERVAYTTALPIDVNES
jgi:Lrp/AsnC family transcriptional regulator